MRKQNRWLMYGVIAALAYYAWQKYQQVQAQRRLTAAASQAGATPSLPSAANF